MEIDITEFVENEAPSDYSASAAELGRNAGQITYGAACEAAEEYPFLDSEEKREIFREYVTEFGAWSYEEIWSWSPTQLTGLLIQLISGDLRAGEERGNLFQGDDGRTYYYVGI